MKPWSDSVLSAAGAARHHLRIAVLAVLTLTPILAFAQPAPTPLGYQLNRAAVEGPGALLEALSQELQRNPQLVATPARAAAVARAAAAPVAGFVGARTPLYRDIAQRIVGAAPPAQRAEIQEAVSDALTGCGNSP